MIDSIVDTNEWDGKNVPTVYLDWLNQEVRVGDTVIYAVTSGRSAGVVLGRILEFRTHDGQGKPLQRVNYSYMNTGAPPEITHLWNFKIQPVKDALSYSWRQRDKDGTIKPVVIGTIHNVTKVDASLTDEVDA